MTTDELRKAAKRLTGGIARQYGTGILAADCAIVDGIVIAEEWLREHPADDGTLLTVNWLSSVAGEGPVVNRWFVIEIGPLEYEPRAEEVGGPVELHPGRSDGKVLRTRGDVRRVAAAIGDPVKEPA